MIKSPDPDPDLPTVVASGVEGVSAAGGMVVGAAAGGPDGAVVGGLVAAMSTPYLLDLAADSWTRIGRLRHNSVAQLLGTAAESLDEDAELMVHRALATDSGAELLAAAVQAASETLNQRKISALGLAVANGLANDQALVDQERLVVRAIADLDEPHIAFLVRLSAFANRAKDGVVIHYEWCPEQAIRGWYQEERHPGPAGVVTPIMNVLRRNGLIEENVEEQLQRQDQNTSRLVETKLRRDPTAPVTPRAASRDGVQESWRVSGFGSRVLQHVMQGADELARVDRDA